MDYVDADQIIVKSGTFRVGNELVDDMGVDVLVEGGTLLFDKPAGSAADYEADFSEGSITVGPNGTLSTRHYNSGGGYATRFGNLTVNPTAADPGNVEIRNITTVTGTLAGVGLIKGYSTGKPMTLTNTATLSPGTSIGTLTTNNTVFVNMEENVMLKFEIEDPDAAAGTGYDLFVAEASSGVDFDVNDTDVGGVLVDLDDLGLTRDIVAGDEFYLMVAAQFDIPASTWNVTFVDVPSGWDTSAATLSVATRDAIGDAALETVLMLAGLTGGTIPTIPGDANGNGFVDDDDLAILLSNWEQDPGTATTWELGDFTADTDVDDDDLAVLLGNWTGPPPGGAAVPEPATLALLGLGGLSLLRRRRTF